MRAAVDQLLPALIPLGLAGAALFPETKDALASLLHSANLGGDVAAMAVCASVAGGGLASLVVDIDRAGRAWAASRSFQSMVKSFMGVQGLDTEIERNVRSMSLDHSEATGQVVLDRLVRRSALFGRAQDETESWAILPGGKTERIHDDRDARRIFGGNPPDVVVEISEIDCPIPLADGLTVAWRGDIEVSATAHGQQRGRWIIDRDGQTLQAEGPWATTSIPSHQPTGLAEDGYTLPEAPDPHVTFEPPGYPAFAR